MKAPKVIRINERLLFHPVFHRSYRDQKLDAIHRAKTTNRNWYIYAGGNIELYFGTSANKSGYSKRTFRHVSNGGEWAFEFYNADPMIERVAL